jgi:hypothetical protein
MYIVFAGSCHHMTDYFGNNNKKVTLVYDCFRKA